MKHPSKKRKIDVLGNYMSFEDILVECTVGVYSKLQRFALPNVV